MVAFPNTTLSLIHHLLKLLIFCSFYVIDVNNNNVIAAVCEVPLHMLLIVEGSVHCLNQLRSLYRSAHSPFVAVSVHCLNQLRSLYRSAHSPFVAVVYEGLCKDKKKQFYNKSIS